MPPLQQQFATIDLLEFAKTLALEAGETLLEYYGKVNDTVSTKSSPTDLVSEADKATEELIRKRITAYRPDDTIIGEEQEDLIGSSGLTWVVDPLDGTINFLYQIPAWCVSIACEDTQGGILGVIYDPIRRELFEATRAGKAFLNGEQIYASQHQDLATTMVATGFGYSARQREQQGEVLAKVLAHARDIRRFGSAALDLAWTACGRFDIFFERGLNPWDMAAGKLICSQVGLQFKELPARPERHLPPGIIVGPEKLVPELFELVK